MTIEYRHLKTRRFPEIRQTVHPRDSMLYTLSLLGQEAVDASALPFVYEGGPGGLRALPSQAVVLGYPGFWAREPDTGIDWVRVVHGEQRMTVHRPLPASGDVVALNGVTHVIDKGAGKGAIVVVERRVETAAGELLTTLQQVIFCRGDGGYSQTGHGQPSDEALPPLSVTPTERRPDHVHEQAIRPEAALLYRLLGDSNPLHADPEVATAAGFPRPILHGLASYGLACWAILGSCANYDPTRLRSLDVRFASPVFPGETLRTEMWVQGPEVRFVSRILERDVVVMSHGRAVLG